MEAVRLRIMVVEYRWIFTKKQKNQLSKPFSLCYMPGENLVEADIKSQEVCMESDRVW